MLTFALRIEETKVVSAGQNPELKMVYDVFVRGKLPSRLSISKSQGAIMVAGGSAVVVALQAGTIMVLEGPQTWFVVA